jgi:hypothetical protein
VSSLKLVEAPAPQRLSANPQPHQAITAKAALEELFELLEDYAPVWYTEEHHDRAIKALRAY